MKRSSLIACAILLGFLPASRGAEPDPPLLMLNTGGPLALTTALEFMPDGRHLVVGSEDKVLRIWNTDSGELTRTLRGQAGQGSYGAIKAIAISPDGRWLAAGGSFGSLGSHEVGDIRLYDLSSGQIERLLEGHSDAVTALRFSGDGRYLVSGSWDQQTIVWDVESGKPVRTIHAHSHVVTAVAFSGDGRFALSAARDEPVMVWDIKEDKLVRKLEGHTETVRAISVSPANRTIVTAAFDGIILRWSPDGAERIGRIDLQAYSIQAASFTEDGRLSVAFWRGSNDQLSAVSALLDAGTGRIIKESVGLGGIRASAVDRSGEQVAVGGGMWGDVIQVWRPTSDRGPTTLIGSGRPVWSVDFSKDGQYVAWGTKYERWSANNYGPLQFRMQLPGATQELGPPEPIGDHVGEFIGPSVRAGDTHVDQESSEDGPDRIWNMDKLKITAPSGTTVIDWGRDDALHGQRHQAFALDRQGKVVVTAGANGAIASYTTDGTLLGSFAGHAGYVWALAISPDSRFLATGGDDETVRIWNLQTRKLIVSIFRAAGDKGDWVVWTPEGYYVSSTDGNKYVGWQVNRGRDAIPNYFTAKQLREQLFRPEIINRALIVGSADQAIEEAKRQNPSRMDFDISVLMRQTPPSLQILSPVSGTDSFGSTEIVVKARVWDTDTSQPPEILAFVNKAALERSRINLVPSGGQFDVTIAVPLDTGANDVWIAARNPVGETTSELSIFNNSETDRRPRTLFAVLVGVDHYPNLGGTCPLSNGCDLQFAGNDAIEFEKALRTKVRPRYRSYKPFLFYNANVQNANASQPDSTDEPTSPKIMEALKTLALAGSEDTIVMFFSGHGTKDRNGEYLLLTSDSQRDINQGTYSNDLPWSKVFKAIKGASGRKLIFLDSCKSGSSFNAEVAKTPDEHIDTYTSTDKPRPSREYPSLSHGAFTAAILRGLRDGKAAIPPSTEVDTWTLGSFLKREVKDLSGGVQTPGLWLANPALVLGD